MRKIPLTEIVLFVIAFIQPFITSAQSEKSKYRNTDDSLVVIQRHQTRWHLYGGLHLSSDAEMYYLGPSFQAGAEVNVTHHLEFSSYFHYFYTGVNDKIDGLIQKGRLRTFTWALLIQLNAGAGWYKGFYFAFGLALQRYVDRFKGSWGSWDQKRSTATAATRFGYTFPAGLNAIAIEFNGIGPYTYYDGPDTITEIFTQVSFGGRFIF